MEGLAPEQGPWYKDALLDGIEATMDSLIYLSGRQVQAVKTGSFEEAERLNSELSKLLAQRGAFVRELLSLCRKPN